MIWPCGDPAPLHPEVVAWWIEGEHAHSLDQATGMLACELSQALLDEMYGVPTAYLEPMRGT